MHSSTVHHDPVDGGGCVGRQVSRIYEVSSKIFAIFKRFKLSHSTCRLEMVNTKLSSVHNSKMRAVTVTPGTILGRETQACCLLTVEL